MGLGLKSANSTLTAHPDGHLAYTKNSTTSVDANLSEWRLFRLWNFSREPKTFELHPPLDAHVALTATTFQASFH